MGYKRVLVKLSGEALAGSEKFGISPEAIKFITEEIGRVAELGIETALVVGGGTSFGGYRPVNRGWTAPMRTIWGCWQR